jgi:hypothetical protein
MADPRAPVSAKERAMRKRKAIVDYAEDGAWGGGGPLPALGRNIGPIVLHPRGRCHRHVKPDTWGDPTIRKRTQASGEHPVRRVLAASIIAEGKRGDCMVRSV